MNRTVLPMALALLLASLPSGWAAAPQTEQEKAITEIEKLGGKVTVDEKSPGKPVIGVDFGNTKVTDAGLALLKRLTNLQSLNLWNTKVTDAGIEHLKGLTKLQVLSVVNTKATDAGLEHLKALTNLKVLVLGATEATDEGMKKLHRALPTCRIVPVHWTLQQVTTNLGLPDRDIGSGIHIYAYRMTDGSDILIGSADGSHILYVRHGTDVLFDRQKR